MVQVKSKNINGIKIGYTTGVFDLFHIGHVNILKNSKELCDKLIVGVTTDELVKYKYKTAVIPFSERIDNISSPPEYGSQEPFIPSNIHPHQDSSTGN